MRLFSIEGKLTELLGVAVAVVAALTAWIGAWLGTPWLGAVVALLLAMPLIAFVARALTAPLMRLLRALQGSVVSLRDGDFSVSLTDTRRDEFGDLVRAHNDLGRVLRDERQNLFQRELLLDTMVQNSPIALVLVDPANHVVYANLTARALLNDGRLMNGFDFGVIADVAATPGAGHRRRRPVQCRDRERRRRFIFAACVPPARTRSPHTDQRLTRELSRQEVKT
jgi:nitrogen fixation/metabolism regulation signal transduction histidine kinase